MFLRMLTMRCSKPRALPSSPAWLLRPRALMQSSTEVIVADRLPMTLRLYRGLDPGRAEAASARAVAVGALTYTSIASILANGLDRTSPPAEAVPVMLHPNLRGPRYFH